MWWWSSLLPFCSLRPRPSSVLCAEPRQLRRRRTEGQLVVLGPQEITEQGIGGVDTDAPMNLLGGRGDSRARLARPEFRDAGLAGGRPVLTEYACGRPHGPPDRLDVDESVGHPLLHGLEAADRTAELLAFGRVRGGDAQRALGDAELDCAEPDEGACVQRLDHRHTVAGKAVRTGNGCTVDEYIGVGLTVGGCRRANVDAARVHVDEKQTDVTVIDSGGGKKQGGGRWSRRQAHGARGE